MRLQIFVIIYFSISDFHENSLMADGTNFFSARFPLPSQLEPMQPRSLTFTLCRLHRIQAGTHRLQARNNGARH